MSSRSGNKAPRRDRRLTLDQALRRWGDYVAPDDENTPSWPGRDLEPDWHSRHVGFGGGNERNLYPPWEMLLLCRTGMDEKGIHRDRIGELQLALRRGHIEAWGVRSPITSTKRQHRRIASNAWAEPRQALSSEFSPGGLTLVGRGNAAVAEGEGQRFIDLFFVDRHPAPGKRGRPHYDQTIDQLFTARRARNEPFVSIKHEAFEIQKEIRHARGLPKNARIPGAGDSTVERVVRKLAAEYFGNQPQRSTT